MFCKYCGSKIPENAKFCQNCGGKLDVNLSVQMSNNNAVLTPNNNSTSMNSIPMTNSASKSNNTILLIFLIIVGICAIVVPIIFMGNDSLKETENKSNEETNINKSRQMPAFLNKYLLILPSVYCRVVRWQQQRKIGNKRMGLLFGIVLLHRNKIHTLARKKRTDVFQI